MDNLFFSEFMPDADGEAVKVYLYGLMQCRYPAMGDVAVSDALHLSEGTVRAAFVYWQRERRGWLPAGACKPVLGRTE